MNEGIEKEQLQNGSNSGNNGHVMAWVSFGLSLANFILACLYFIPILAFMIIISCAVLAVIDIAHSGKSIPAIIAIIVTTITLVLGGLTCYQRDRLADAYNQEKQRLEQEWEEESRRWEEESRRMEQEDEDFFNGNHSTNGD